MADIIPNVVVSMPSQLFTLARSFKAAANGSIYVGRVDTDPLIPANQVQAYVSNEDGTYTEVAQPIKINAGGYPVFEGQIAKFVTVEGQSMTVLDSFGVQQFYFPSVIGYDADQLRQQLDAEGGAVTVNKLAANDGLKMVGRCPDIATLRTIEPTTDKQPIEVISYSSATFDRSHSYSLSTAGLYEYDSSDTTTPDNDWLCIVTAGGKRWKKVIESTMLNLASGGVLPGADLGPKLQAAINAVSNYVIANGFYGRPVIAINSGLYTTSLSLSIPSWVSIVAYGNVVINGSSLTATEYVAAITNNIAGVSTQYHQGENLSSIGGTLEITAGGKTTSNANGLFVGNTASSMSACRNVSLRNVSVVNTKNALTFGAIDTYLFSAQSCRFETNRIGINSPTATNSNSGERMSFTDCTIAGNDIHHILNNTPAMDIGFINCSFDFTNGDVLHIGANAGFFDIKFINPHIEGFDGFIVQSEGTALYRLVSFVNPTFLPRMRDGSQYSPTLGLANSPSRILFNAPNSTLTISGMDLRTEQPPYKESVHMSDSGALILNTSLGKSGGFQVCPSLNHILNRGYNFGDETIGTIIASGSLALTRFTASGLINMTGLITDRADGGGPQLQLTSTGANASITLTSNDFIPVKAGGRVGVYGALQLNTSTGSTSIIPKINFYDSQDVLISSVTGNQVSMLSLFGNANLPNYADGNARYIACQPTVFIVPRGAVNAKVVCQFFNVSGVANASRVSIYSLD